MRTSILAGLVLLSVWPAAAHAQNDRFGRFEPGLIIQTGGRTGACDVLLFTPDGKRLLAAGDDKIVPVWECTGKHTGQGPGAGVALEHVSRAKGLDLCDGPLPQRRWRACRYRGYGRPDWHRSPHQAQYRGSHPWTGRGSERALGHLVAGLFPVRQTSGRWPWRRPGCRLGSDKDGPTPDKKDNNIDGRFLGQHTMKGAINDVHLVFFTKEDQCVSVAETGEVIEWDLNQKEAGANRPFPVDSSGIFRAVASHDRKWIAVANQNGRKLSVEVRALDGSLPTPIKLALGGDDLPQCLAFDNKRERLAVGVRTVPADGTFCYETNGKVVIYDLAQSPPQPSVRVPFTYYPEAMTFHTRATPDRLATAGGENHELILWDIGRKPAVGAEYGGWGEPVPLGSRPLDRGPSTRHPRPTRGRAEVSEPARQGPVAGL